MLNGKKYQLPCGGRRRLMCSKFKSILCSLLQSIVGESDINESFLTLRIEVFSQSKSDNLRLFIEFIASAEKLC